MITRFFRDTLHKPKFENGNSNLHRFLGLPSGTKNRRTHSRFDFIQQKANRWSVVRRFTDVMHSHHSLRVD